MLVVVLMWMVVRVLVGLTRVMIVIKLDVLGNFGHGLAGAPGH